MSRPPRRGKWVPEPGDVVLWREGNVYLVVGILRKPDRYGAVYLWGDENPPWLNVTKEYTSDTIADHSKLLFRMPNMEKLYDKTK